MSYTSKSPIKGRYVVRTITRDVYSANNTARLMQVGWDVYDYETYKTVQSFEMGEHEQAEGLCKLMNSIEEEGANNVRGT